MAANTPHTPDPRFKDFRNFAFVLWKELGLPDPTKVQYDICLFLQQGPRRRMIEAFRGVGKSWLTAAYVLWRLYWNPNERIMVVSASKDRADAFSIFVKSLIHRTHFLKHLAPDPSQGQRDSSLAFDVGPSEPHQSPSVKSVGITGQLTGSRATIIVADDIETPKNSLTILMRERLGELVKEFDAVLVPGGEIIYLGTPQCEESIYNLLPDRGYEIRVWPARYPDAEWLAHYSERFAPMLKQSMQDGAVAGRSTDPARFSDEDLRERELSYGRSGFALQFQLDTRMSDALKYPLRLSDLMVINMSHGMGPLKASWGSGPDQLSDLPSVGLKGDRFYRPLFVHKDFSEFTGAVMFVDPAGRGKDETAYVVVKMLNGLLYLTGIGGFKQGYTDEVLESLGMIAKIQRVSTVVVEPNFGDGMFLKLLSPFLSKHHKCELVEAERAGTQKEHRIIDTLEPILNQHRLVVTDEVVRHDLATEDTDFQLFYQLTRITKDRGSLRHDDRLDALAGAVAYWTQHMDRSVDAAVAQVTAKALKDELTKFSQHVFGYPKKRPGTSRHYSF